MSVIEKTIGGEKRAFRFGLGFLGEILDELDTDISGFGAKLVKNPFKVVPLILYYSYKSECEIQSRTLDITLGDVYNWLEKYEGSYSHPDVNDILELMMDSVMKYIPKYEGSSEDPVKPKKKSIGKKT